MQNLEGGGGGRGYLGEMEKREFLVEKGGFFPPGRGMGEKFFPIPGPRAKNNLI